MHPEDPEVATGVVNMVVVEGELDAAVVVVVVTVAQQGEEAHFLVVGVAVVAVVVVAVTAAALVLLIIDLPTSGNEESEWENSCIFYLPRYFVVDKLKHGYSF